MDFNDPLLILLGEYDAQTEAVVKAGNVNGRNQVHSDRPGLSSGPRSFSGAGRSRGKLVNGDLVLVVGIVLLVFGAAGVLVSLLFLVWVFGAWTMAVAVGFAVVAVIGVLMVGAAE